MAQMLQPVPATPQLHLPETPLIYSNQESYFADFKILEKKILKDVGDTWKGTRKYTINVMYWNFKWPAFTAIN